MQTNETWALVNNRTSSAAVGKAAGFARYPFWLWWNLLSLDAPTIACLWALLFAHALHVAIPTVASVVLTLTVWIVYAADRVLDGLRSEANPHGSDRHKFYDRHCYVVLGVLLAALVFTSWISATKLNRETQLAGLVLSAVVVLYLFVIHVVPARFVRSFPKEIVTGVIFSVGSAIPAWTHASHSRNNVIPSVFLFAAVCTLNCVAIECWENHRAGRDWQRMPSWMLRAADRHITHIALGLIAALLLMVLFNSQETGVRELLAAASASLAIIAILDHGSNDVSSQALRVLADVALLTPALLLLK